MEGLVKQLTSVLIALLLTLIQTSSSHSTVNFSILKDPRIPTQCSSPGWKAQPHDVSVVVGSYAYFECFSSYPHKDTVWFHLGRKIDTSYSSAHRFSIYNGKKSLKFGPIRAEDSGAVIGCDAVTSYGPLPSKVGKITVLSAPRYSPHAPRIQTAYLDQPFDFDFSYTSKSPPSHYSWYKDGWPFKPDGSRVTVDHTGIIFTKILYKDAGRYSVRAYTQRFGSTQATATLKVVYGKHVQSGNSQTPVLSTKLAVPVSLSKLSARHHSSYHIKPYSPHNYDHLTSSSYVKHVMRLVMHFKRPTQNSHYQGQSRLESEAILRDIHKLVSPHSKLHLSEHDLEKIANFTNCSVPKQFVKCLNHSLLKYRTIDGTCNNFFYPLNGAAETPFARILPANYEDGISLPVGHSQMVSGDFFSPPWPSARQVSFRIINDLKIDNPDDTAVMFMQFAQFLDHDLDLAPVFEDVDCGCDLTEKCIPIEVSPDDAVFGARSSNMGKCLPFVRSVPACVHGSQSSLPRNQINDLTSYIDASNIYGSDKELANNLRLFKGGLLKQGNRLKTLKGNLPFQADTPNDSVVPFFIAGDARSNEQIGLTIMHTVWLREHNRIARQLMKINPCWSDEILYQETRKIMGAINQVIVYEEFLPVLFGQYFNIYVPPFKGYNPFIDATVPNSFAGAAYRFGHSLVRDRLDRLDKDFRRLDIGPLPLRRAFFNPIVYFESLGTDPILRGMLVNESNPTDEFVNRVLTSQLFVERNKTLGGDLATLNIQRSRDHGLPTYRTWEKFCKKLFPGITPQFKRQSTIQNLKKLYGSKGFEKGIDLWVGGLSEKRLPGAQVGPTFACIIGLTFSRVRDGDRFYYENPYVFTPYQLLELKKASLAKVICNNADNIPKVQRAVFKIGGERVKCSTIPEINLWKWQDRKCYHRSRYG